MAVDLETHGLGGDDVVSLRAIELGNTLDEHVVALGGSACKYNILALSTNKLRDLL
jgi:hypothetical protein